MNKIVKGKSSQKATHTKQQGIGDLSHPGWRIQLEKLYESTYQKADQSGEKENRWPAPPPPI